MNKPNLENKVVVITGGAGVLCSSFAKSLAACGASVAILDINEEKAKEVASQIVSLGYKAIGVKANILEKESIEQAHRIVQNSFGACDILINGAGGNHPKATTTDEFFNLDALNLEGNKSIFDLDLESFNFVFGINFTGTLLTSQVFAKDMIGRNGTIVNVSSMNAFTPLTKIPAYSAAKAAVSNFTKWLAVYFAKSAIRVNAIAPGFFSTSQNKSLLWNPDGTPTERSNKILRNTPMGRFGEAEELIGTIFWLVDNDSSGFITGVVVPIDGGFSAYSGV